MGILDPTASNIGHGQLGLRSGLRTLSNLYGESACQKHYFTDVFGAKALASGWTVDSGSVYKITVNETFDGRRLDVVKAYRSTETLTRVDSRAAVVAGSYYYDSMATGASTLYVQLSSSDPNTDTSVMIAFGFYFGTVSAVHPSLGPDLMVDGELDVWTDASNLTNYLVAGNSGDTNSSLSREASVVYSGSFSAKLTSTLVAGGSYRWRIGSEINTAVGAIYRYSGYYRSAQSNGSSIVPLLLVGHGSNLLSSNGRDIVGSSDALRFLTLTDSRGEWNHFCFDFIANDTSVNLTFGLYCLSNGGTGTGSVYFDKFAFQRVYRYEYYEQRLALGSVPTFSRGRKSIFFDRWFVGSGSLSVQNGEAGYLETLFGQYEFANQEMVAHRGGRYQDGDEILIEDMQTIRFVQRKPMVGDELATLQLDDPLTILKEKLPRRTFNPNETPAIDPRDQNRPRSLVFGGSFGFRPVRTAKSGSTGYGTYEAVDPKYITNVNPTLSAAGYAYSSEEAANKANLQEQALETSHSTTDATVFTVNTDIKTVRIKTGENDLLDFDQGGAALVAVIPAGLYCVNAGSPTLANAVQTAMNAVGTGITVSYSDTTHKYTITKSAGTLNLRLTSAAANAAKSGWRTLGYTSTTDKTGSLSYAADTAMFSACDAEHILRVNVIGYKDDTSGTYTGSASATIARTMDIVYFLLNRVFGLPSSRVDTAALAAIRGSDFSVRCTIGRRSDVEGDPSPMEFGQILEQLENSTGIDCIFIGDKFTFKVRDNSTPSNVIDLWDRDFGSFESYYEQDDLASVTRLIYEDQTNTGFYATAENESAKALSRLGGVSSLKTWRVYNDSSSVSSRQNAFIANTENKRRRFRFTVKGVCMGLNPMDKVRINRSVYMGRAGDSNNRVLVRILNKTDNEATWESTIEAAEVLSVTNGW